MITLNVSLADFVQNSFSIEGLSAQFLNTEVMEFKTLPLNTMCFDSRAVNKGDVFVALPSVAANELQYMCTAMENGCALVVLQQSLFNAQQAEIKQLLREHQCAVAVVSDVMLWAGDFLHTYYQRATDQLDVVGITGTNGKSSISFYIAQLMNELQSSCAVMGTLGYGPWDQLKTTGMTTLPLDKLHHALAELAQSFSNVAIEVSSHGLEQKRLAGVNFKGAVFSNLSQDHLDYHGTMEAYGAEKAKLFTWPDLEFAIVNKDDKFGASLLEACEAKSVISYGQSSHADFSFEIKAVVNNGLDMEFTYLGQTARNIVPLYGKFNGYNAAAALATVVALGFDFSQAVKALSALKAVEGRMMQVKVGKANQPLVLVDYAHTPDALQQVLQSVQNHCAGNIHLVVGCGGDRDQTKRPLMGKIAVQFADKVMFTSDNPRTESAASIVDQMVADIEHTQAYECELDRKLAIQKTINDAQANDLVIIAGKGHEDYQEINGQRSYFSDKAVAQETLLAL